jgi:glycylpeptide N-tetradecanoyltransferase
MNLLTKVDQDPATKAITDFFSFYSLNSTVIAREETEINVAYLYYYATTTTHSTAALKTRLNELMQDALIFANNAGFDVFNALTLQDNNMFLEKQKFGAGDGYLHYYLFNYRTAPVKGGFNSKGQLDEGGSEVGVVML